MDKRLKLFFTFTFVVFLISGLYVFTNWFSIITGYFVGEDEKTKLAQCLDGKETEFYGAEYCAECEKQKDLFGTSFKAINYINCGKAGELCPNIKSVPAWYVNKTIHYGYKNITKLQELSGCAPDVPLK
jgi:hypothetical protein